MAETLSSINVTASTRKSGQYKLIAGLAAALIFLFAFSGSEEEPVEHHEAASDMSAAAGSDSAATSNASSPSREIFWPEIPLEFLLTHNPFHSEVPRPENPAIAAQIPAGGVATKNTSSTSMPQPDMTVQMLFQSARGKAAMIDNQIYHEGDRVKGFEIASITQAGVTLRRTETPLQPPGR